MATMLFRSLLSQQFKDPKKEQLYLEGPELGKFQDQKTPTPRIPS